eukprot:CAMPEP_0172593230 /NCGR_PEP_ID=MMETSP1068-20121228/12415_1 /TAXON_ID=35684 /ORGANISM="Pseudopedinella elastica, Strain CCMP716" /LENGTH=237 /DNA_ID=CAMNT_0013390657 /DNA_START=108 /DNA_END=817 /DNA_ORIENTATION=+
MKTALSLVPLTRGSNERSWVCLDDASVQVSPGLLYGAVKAVPEVEGSVEAHPPDQAGEEQRRRGRVHRVVTAACLPPRVPWSHPVVIRLALAAARWLAVVQLVGAPEGEEVGADVEPADEEEAGAVLVHREQVEGGGGLDAPGSNPDAQPVYRQLEHEARPLVRVELLEEGVEEVDAEGHHVEHAHHQQQRRQKLHPPTVVLETRVIRSGVAPRHHHGCGGPVVLRRARHRDGVVPT